MLSRQNMQQSRCADREQRHRVNILRIAIVATGEIFGGAERQILTLARCLAARDDCHAELLLLHDRQLAAEARRLGLPIRILGARGLLDVHCIKAMNRAIHDDSIDVISVHGYRSTTYLALSRQAKRIPIMKTEHGAMEIGRGSLSERLKAWLYRGLDNWATHRLKATRIYVTHDLQRLCATEHRGSPHRIIYNGIDVPSRAATSRPKEYSEGLRHLVVVGRLEHVKGVDIAIRAMADPCMPPGTHLHVIGAGPDTDSLTRLAHDIGVAERVSMLGFRSNVYDYVAHADVLLLPSRHEGLPYTLLEAMSLGTPVIASRVGGLAEVLTDERQALLVAPEDPAGLAAATHRLLESASLKDALSGAAAQLVQERFTASLMSEHYLALAVQLVKATRDRAIHAEQS